MKRAAGLVAAISTVAVLALGAAPAFAHVDPDPLAMQAGTTATIAFGIEHGCSGSPTKSLEIQIPPDVTNVKPVEKAGWTAVVAGDKVTISGGSLSADTKDHFDLSLTAPAAAGVVHFPVVQTCEAGVTRWIEIGEEGKPEPELPAATLKITAGPPTADDLKPADEAPATKRSSSHAGLYVAIAAAVVVLGGGAAVVVRRRRSTSQT